MDGRETKRRLTPRRRPPVLDVGYRPGEIIEDEAGLARGIEALRRIDPDFVGHALAVGGTPDLRRREPGFEGLATIIVSQQVSTASAAAIFRRLRAAIDPFEPSRLAAAGDEVLRGCGLSIQKMRTLRTLAGSMTAGDLDLEALRHEDAEMAVRKLVALPGIGAWTADVFLLFCLGHPDAWPAADIALQEAARLALGLTARPGRDELHHIGERWRPHRAVAARLLWSYYRAVKKRAGIVLAENTAPR